MWNKDSIWIGIGLGILIPIAVYGLFYLGMELAGLYVSDIISEKMQLVLMGVNAIVMRYFLINRQQDQIGKGILLVTFIGVIAHFIKYYSHSL